MKVPIDLEPLFPDRASAEALGAQLIRRLRAAIESGFFPPASRLLPSRELAARLGVSRNTVTGALDQLVAEGYLESRVGAGTYVAAAVGAARAETSSRPVQSDAGAGAFAAIAARLDAVGSSYGALRNGSPDLSSFPLRVWQRLERKNLTAAARLGYGDAVGAAELRTAISRHIAQFRGVVAEPEQIIVVEGTQGALHLVAFALTRPGDAIAIEDPCYQDARALFEAHRLALRAVRVDEQGMQTHDLPRGCRLAYVTPSHQFPLGGAMPVARRGELLAWARRTDTYIVEDDYDSEFAAHPLPALQSLDRGDRVIYVGTFSKTLAPGVRVGYAVVPRRLVPAFSFARSVSGRGLAPSVQQTIADFVTAGHFSRYIRRMGAVCARRRAVLLDALGAGMPHGFAVGPAQTGLHVALLGPPDFDDVRLANGLPDGNRVLPISLLCIERSDCRGLVVGYSDSNDERVAAAATQLTAAIRAQIARRR
jgi:GntR family transcriptional regulator / MocR family aminotransferase